MIAVTSKNIRTRREDFFGRSIHTKVVSKFGVLGILLALSTPAQAVGFPDVLYQKMQQGVQACLDYYQTGAKLTSLQKYGFSISRKGMESEHLLPGQRHKTNILVLTEGLRNRECETHTDYLKGGVFKDAFELTITTLRNAGFQEIRKAKPRPGSKSIWRKGTASMFMKIDLRKNKSGIEKLMIKFKRK